MLELERSLRLWDGLAMVVGIMVGSGIFRTPGLVAARLGRPWLTFVAWTAGGALAFLGALLFAELATRLPRAGGKYVYARAAFGPRAAFVVGWVEALGIYAAAIAAIGVAAGEFLVRLTGWPAAAAPWAGVGFVALFTVINLVGVASGRWVQNLVTAAKVVALGGVVVIALAHGNGSGWHGVLPGAPRGAAVWGALGVALIVVLASLNGNVFVTPRVLFGMAREGLAPATLTWVNRGGTPWVAMLVVGAVALGLAATGTFGDLLTLAIVLILLIDGFVVSALFRLRARASEAPFRVPFFPALPVLFLLVYAALFVGTALAQPLVVAKAMVVLVAAYGVSWVVK